MKGDIQSSMILVEVEAKVRALQLTNPPVDECQPNPCSHGGTCSPTLSGYTCYCEDGYKGDTCEGNCDTLGN